jgi:predicted nucleic acid-binding protein
LRRVLSALPLWFATDLTWSRMESWVEEAGQAGRRFGVVDLLIGAIAAEHGAAVWSHDRDFERMTELGLIDRHVP